MASNTGRSDQLSTAEQGQGRPSLDENTGLLSGQPRRLSQPNGQPSNGSSNNKRPASTSKRSFLSGSGRKKIIVSLTAISGGLLIILGFALFKKIGTDP
ncbi:hypothetical protein BGZ90_008242, partial [Linnemannia elongata]